MKVFLTGASGFVGSNLVRRLLRDGHAVRALVHRSGVLSNEAAANVEEVKGDINAPTIADAMAGCEAVINLVGIIYERGGSTFETIHNQGTRNLVRAAKQSGVRRFVQMSALGARPTNASPYHTTKFAAEEEVRNSGIPHVVLRPSLIFGPGSAFVTQMLEVMKAAPFFRPVPGTGDYRFRPVHVDDVAECFVQSLTSQLAVNQTVDLVGAEELSLNEIAAEIAASAGIRKTPVHIPIPFMKMAAAFFSFLPVKPPVTSAQIRMLQEGSTADPEPMKRIFQIEPISFRTAMNGRQ